MNYLKSAIFGAVAMLAASVSPVQATVVDFNSLPADNLANSFSDGGLDFAVSICCGVWGGNSPNSDGTNNVIAGYGSSLTITRTGGGLFDLSSIEMAISWYSALTSTTILINGNPWTITTTLTNLALGLTGVSSVVITGIPDGYWTADNLDVNLSAVPLPGALPFLVAGLGSLGWLSRRRTHSPAA